MKPINTNEPDHIVDANKKIETPTSSEVGCRELLAELISQMDDIQAAIFDREDDFLDAFCGGDPQELLGFWLGAENCKFVWITTEGQHITDNQPTTEILNFLS